MLPIRNTDAVSLADVLPNSLQAIVGESGKLHLPAVDSAIVILVDGLGSSLLKSHAGHARTLASGRRSTLSTVFPSTTAAALTSFTTGVLPGEHGLVGYRTRDIDNDRLVNQLNGWDAGLDPATWQRSTTVFEGARNFGISSHAVGPAIYAGSGFTAAVLRGAEYHGADSLEERFDVALDLARTQGRLIYLYVPELDKAAHQFGCESDRWLHSLEHFDAALRAGLQHIGKTTGLLVTADHGVIDIPESAQILFDEVPELIDNVRHVGGEPRCLQLYLDRDATAEDRQILADSWSTHESSRAWVSTREEAIDAGLFGVVHPEVLPRIGDVIVAARKRVVYYDGRASDHTPRRMIGQHGSLTPEETNVPLVRFGAFDR